FEKIKIKIKLNKKRKPTEAVNYLGYKKAT
ncbi:MAG: hypothetical protein ACD_5C00293G0005, partial [uncultured bacterium]